MTNSKPQSQKFVAVIKFSDGRKRTIKIPKSETVVGRVPWPSGVYSVTVDGYTWTYEMVKRPDGKIVPWNGTPLYGSLLAKALQGAMSCY